MPPIGPPLSQGPCPPELALFHAPVREWFSCAFAEPTQPQKLGWPAIAGGESALILAPTGAGKTLAAFLWCINRLMFSPSPPEPVRCRVVYLSPIKALAVDVERNLQRPLAGIAEAARRLGISFHEPNIAIRTGDTPQVVRARFARHPADILITTPESLYLMLTSNVREMLRSVEAVIVDEIHALVPTKRGSHLALSLERLEHLAGRKLQRIGLSATQRPLDEVARYLGGCTPSAATLSADEPHPSAGEEVLGEFASPAHAPTYRPVRIVDASEPKRFDLRVQVPVEDMSRLDTVDALPSGDTMHGSLRGSIWSAIYPQLLELVRAHRSTLIFVNNRRLAERIAGAVNELAGEPLVRAHHGSVALTQRREIEDHLKRGTIRGLVATSSLELGIDMGAIDLVVQVESPPSVASGMQRVGRASHHLGAVSNAVLFPKFRADLVACAAITRAMYEGQVESVHFPRNPLDVLAQQIVSAVAMESWQLEDLFGLVRSAAPFASLTRPVFENLLDMLSGRYPSEEFAELRPRITWDRISNRLTARQGAKRIAILNGGTIPDRGLYGVFLAGATKGARVGELDEEMVFESRTGDVIVLGASSWRIDEISHDRVVVSPAPGVPGKMPFWKGDGPGRPAEFGRRIGEMTRELLTLPRTAAFTRLVELHSLDRNAAENVLRYLEEQRSATQRVPSDEDVVIEICRDELGDRRVCIMTPFGSRVHAPWCMAAVSNLRKERRLEVESLWSDDGFVLRIPDNDDSIDSGLLLPSPKDFRELVLRQLGSSSVFAARFREAAGRALLLPKHRAGLRAPLWQQRKRAGDLLAVASRFSSFPILLESYRDCLRDFFDMPAAVEILAAIERGEIRVTRLESEKPSPFAASLLFSYVANYIYDGDAPLAERRAQALSIDASQLQELLGDSDLRELLDPLALEEVESRLQFLAPEYRARHADGLHDLLLKLGDLSAPELTQRSDVPEVAGNIAELVSAGRALPVAIAGENRFIPVEYAARYRDALGLLLPVGIPRTFLEPTQDPLPDIARRYARTRGPFTTQELAARYGQAHEAVGIALHALHGRGQLLEGEFRPHGVHHEWCDPEVLQHIRRKSLARLRKEVEPVEQATFARFLTRWQGVASKRRVAGALLDVVESLQGAALLASEVERAILPARLSDYKTGDLDTLMAAGEIVWVGLEQVGDRDGRIALYLTDSLPLLLPPDQLRNEPTPLSERAAKIEEFLRGNGASFFAQVHAALGGFPRETQDALWELVWAGRATNDTFHPLRNLIASEERKRDRAALADGPPGSPELLRRLRLRTSTGGQAQGRWSLVRQRIPAQPSVTQWSVSVAQQLLARNGLVMRDTAQAEDVSGGYPAIYPALKTMEESGRIRRGMFVAGLGAAQFAMPAAVDLLRSLRSDPAAPEAAFLAAADPANPYGTILRWPRWAAEDEASNAAHGMSRTRGAGVILVNGILTAFLRRQNPALRVFLPDSEPERSQLARPLASKLGELAVSWQGRRSGMLIGEINDAAAREHFLAPLLVEAGFRDTAQGFQMRRVVPTPPAEEEADEPGEEAQEFGSA
ncbi:MAG TPA: DEAD/DEAH box helicase [Candidatus Eisenbacteria bacterium]|nr:DEAD/DEAH box helicase [Candidatus Eisenbacteria bacterium]